MDWSSPVDQYCERTDPSFWAEPVNALTNAAFIIAALVAYVQWQRAGGRDLPLLALIVMTAAIGVGSFIFHTFATRGAMLFDIAPISIFIYGYLLLALQRFLRLSLTLSLVLLGIFAVIANVEAAITPPDTLDGSHAYLPAFLALFVVAFLARGEPAGRFMIAAAAVLAMSLVLRTIDMRVCAVFPLGTHFLWHTLNGVVLYLLLFAALKTSAAKFDGLPSN